jgi:hypothetical protein
MNRHHDLTRTSHWFVCCVLFLASIDFCRAAPAMVVASKIDWGTWGTETNDLCAGVLVPPTEITDVASQRIEAYVLTSKSNAFWNYVKAPGGAFRKIELRGTNGVALAPSANIRKVIAECPGSIRREDLPLTHGMFANQVTLSAGQPYSVGDFTIRDLYRIEKEGDFLMSVCVIIYEFATNRQSVSRIDLPCVRAKVHLTPNIP